MVIPSVADCVRIYGFPIIHKLTLAFRPIVSNVGTASYNLTCFLAHSLAHLTCNNIYTVKNSYGFVDKLKHYFSLKLYYAFY